MVPNGKIGIGPGVPSHPDEREQGFLQGQYQGFFRVQVRSQPHHRALFDGIHRFVFEDRVVLYPHKSRSQNRKEAKPIAYQVIARSNAWSRLVAEQFPRALRLSIHPQPDHSEKIGLLLLRAVDNWITPWHGAVLLEEDGFVLLKRSQAEEAGARLVKSSHFER